MVRRLPDKIETTFENNEGQRTDRSDTYVLYDLVETVNQLIDYLRKGSA